MQNRGSPFARRDHPRICGEHTAVGVLALASAGSSPHMRGTHWEQLKHAPCLRIIPAYAGNTHTHCQSTLRPWDHPRICGEHLYGPWLRPRSMGSSPHMRGTLSEERNVDNKTGIIPAYAGNTAPRTASQPWNRDHPRICGEHYSVSLEVRSIPGSSPHMRGTHTPQVDVQWPHGIIPAYAGNTQNYGVSVFFCRDHPRICGEHSASVALPMAQQGSSPHMRGTQMYGLEPPSTVGIIPAYAGNTYTPYRFGRDDRDHPRICGEHCLATRPKICQTGSSPHMRGTPRLARQADNRVGIIPAYAGNTERRSGLIRPDWDHPRICGEHRLPWRSV